MNTDILLTILIFVLIVESLVIAGLSAYVSFRWNREVMWFHGAGRSLAQHEIEKANIALKEKEVEVARMRAENEAAQLDIEKKQRMASRGKFGASPKVLQAEGD